MKKIIVVACMASFPVHAEEVLNCKVYQPEPKKHAQCLLRDYKHVRKVDPGSLADALRAIKKGDHYFKLKDFDNAYEAYDTARINSRNPYAHIRLGDTVVAPLATATEFWGDDKKANGACLTPRHFNELVDLTLTNTWATGAELAKILKTQPPVSNAMIAAVEEKMRCMRALAEHYKQTKPACVDVAKVDACYTGVPAKADSEKSAASNPAK